MNIYVPNQNDIIHETSVDFVLRPCAKEVHIVQYDKSLPIVKVELFRNGERYVLPENAAVNVRVGKLDHTFVYDSILGTNEERNIVYFEISEQMATIPGRIWPVLEVIENSKVACSSPIHLIIERNPIQEGQIESHDDFPIIYELQGTVADHESRISALENQTGDVVTLHTNQYDIDGEKGFTSNVSVGENGSLSLLFTPTSNSHAVTKGYVDNGLASKVPNSGDKEINGPTTFKSTVTFDGSTYFNASPNIKSDLNFVGSDNKTKMSFNRDGNLYFKDATAWSVNIDNDKKIRYADSGQLDLRYGDFRLTNGHSIFWGDKTKNRIWGSGSNLYLGIDNSAIITLNNSTVEFSSDITARGIIQSFNKIYLYSMGNTDYAVTTKKYVDDSIASAVSSVYKYKGSVATYNDLPSTGLTVGDVYNIEDTGDNYAWTGSVWDKLAGTVDLSIYYTITQTDNLLSNKVDKSGSIMTGALGFQDAYHVYYIQASNSDSLLFKRDTTNILLLSKSVVVVNNDLRVNQMGTDDKSATTKEYVDNALASKVPNSGDKEINGPTTFKSAVNFDSLAYSNYGEFRFNNHLYFTDNTDQHNNILQLFNNDIIAWKTLTCKSALNVDGLIYAGGREIRFNNDYLNFTDNTDNHNTIVQIHKDYVNTLKQATFLSNIKISAQNDANPPIMQTTFDREGGWVNFGRGATFKAAAEFNGLIWAGGREIRFPDYVEFKDNTEQHNTVLKIDTNFINAEKIITAKQGINIDVQPTEVQHAVRKDYVDNLVSNKAAKVGPLPSYSVNGSNIVYDFVRDNGLNRKPIILMIDNIPYFASFGIDAPMNFELERCDTASPNSRFVGSFSTSYTFNQIIDVSHARDYETENNKVTSLSSSSTDKQYPSAKCVYSELASKYTKPSTGIPASDLAPGSSGQVLYTDSNGNVIWKTVSGTGSVTSITAGTGLTTTSDSMTDGGSITTSGTLYLTKVLSQGDTKCKVTYDVYGRVIAGDDLAASDIPSLDAAKITSGTFSDDKIASASTWNAKYGGHKIKFEIRNSSGISSARMTIKARLWFANGSSQAVNIEDVDDYIHEYYKVILVVIYQFTYNTTDSPSLFQNGYFIRLDTGVEIDVALTTTQVGLLVLADSTIGGVLE